MSASTDEEKIKISSSLSTSQAGLTPAMAIRAAKAAKQADVVLELAAGAATNFIDKIWPSGHEPFGPQLIRIQLTYHVYVWATYALSLAIADYGDKFDKEIIKLCADKSLTVEQRRTKLGQFIKEAEAVHTLAKGIMTNLNDLQDELTTFIAVFSAWVTQMVLAWEAAVKALLKQLSDTQQEVERIRAAAAAIIGLPYSRAAIQDAAVSDHVGEDYANDTVAAIDALGKLWQAVSNDTQSIELWLERGAKDADMPEYMKLSLDQAVSTYSDLATALRAYTSTLIEGNIPRPN